MPCVDYINHNIIITSILLNDDSYAIYSPTVTFIIIILDYFMRCVSPPTHSMVCRTRSTRRVVIAVPELYTIFKCRIIILKYNIITVDLKTKKNLKQRAESERTSMFTLRYRKSYAPTSCI